MSTAEMITTTEVASLLSVSVMTVHNWKRSGLLVPVDRCNRGYNLYTREQIREFRDTRTQGAAGYFPRSSINAAAVAKQLGVSIQELDRLEVAGSVIIAGRSATNRRFYTPDQIEVLKARLDAGAPKLRGISPRVARILMSRRQAADMLSVNVRTLYHWENDQVLIPVVKVGQQCFYTRNQVAHFKTSLLLPVPETRRVGLPRLRKGVDVSNIDAPCPAE